MHPLLIAVVAIIVYVYISYYYRYPADVKVLNAFADEFNTDIMTDKQPIVLLENRATSLDEFKNHTTPYLLSKTVLYNRYDWNKNPCKYLFIRASEPTSIHLLPASKYLTVDNNPHPDEILITLRLKPDHILILPFHWYYYCDKTDLELLGANDYISWMLL